MRKNIVKDKLAKGLYSLGTWMQLPDPSVAEIIGQAGYDWVAIDMEHGHFSRQALPGIFRSLELGDTMPFVRLAKSDNKEIKEALDAGAKGIILPNIIDPEQLDFCIRNAFYPPTGVRGVGYSRSNLFGGNFDSYAAEHVEEIVMVAQIEDIQAVNKLEQLLKVKGLDAIIIGPYDLSGSMGITGQFEHPEFVNVMNTINGKAKAMNIPMGLHIVQPDEKHLKNKISEGYQFLAYGTDAVFLYQSSQNPLINVK